MEDELDFLDEFREGFEEELIPEDADIYEPEVQYMAERNVFERANISKSDEILRVLLGGGEGDKKLDDLNKRMFRLNLSDLEKFKVLVAIFFNKYKEDLHYSFNDFDIIIEKISRIKDVKYKNPLVYVISYYLLVDGQLSKKRFKYIKDNILKPLDDVKEPDIVRYGRLWTELLR